MQISNKNVSIISIMRSNAINRLILINMWWKKWFKHLLSLLRLNPDLRAFWQCDGKGGSLPQYALTINVTAMILYNSMAYCQTQTCSLPRFFGSKEGI